ncbi:hypothetical protein CYMTET_18952 [Cymbomonas tetramitiformis]|uniref:Barrier-to-autointegration factor n=1 Tax=Cymbomonas tetramitiformis TaxID=36881 RepID=A0AAE0G6Y3_9CHLO|nr:hypothetical protein CYMTET_18952 [Cymbomonas tetramitiformis]
MAEGTATKKMMTFADDPIGDQPVTALPGVGDVTANKLCAAGFSKAYNVLGQLLVFGLDEAKFIAWFKETTGGNDKLAKDCYQGLLLHCSQKLQIST